MNFLIILPFIISFLIGFCLYQNLTISSVDKNKFSLSLVLSLGLGLAVSSFLTFLSFVFLNTYNKSFVVNANLITLFLSAGLLIFRITRNKTPWQIFPKFSLTDILLFLLMLVLSIPAMYWGSFFLYGGWDAWSTWNLKAKMLFLGGDHWKDIFDPILWRASPHYPLLLPLINVWGWSFSSTPLPVVPLLTSYLFMLMTVSLLYHGLKFLISTRWAFVCVALLLLHTYYMKIAMSQYCDIVLSFYLLAALICLIICKKENNLSFAVLAGIFLGLLTFTKPEGLVACGLLIILSAPHLIKHAKTWKEKLHTWFFMMGGFAAGFIPTALFHFYAPANQTMINGLFSKDHPSDWERLDVIWKFYLIEMLGDFSPWKGLWVGTWRGIWLALIIIIVIALLRKIKLFDSLSRIIPLFIVSYMSVIAAYYYINTYFPIAWWMQVSLHRIYFSLLPLVLFWMFYALWTPTKKGTS